MIPKQVYNKWKAYVNESRGLVSSGILLYRKKGNDIEVYIVHAGGPYNENNRYAWGIPKGQIERGESAIDTAIREFEEEMGIGIPNKVSFDLGTIQTGSGKIVYGFACEGDLPKGFKPKSNTVDVYWRGKQITVSEVDEGAWFSAQEAMNVISPPYIPFIKRLLTKIK